MQPQDNRPRRPTTDVQPDRGHYVPVDRYRQTAPATPPQPVAQQPKPQFAPTQPPQRAAAPAQPQFAPTQPPQRPIPPPTQPFTRPGFAPTAPAARPAQKSEPRKSIFKKRSVIIAGAVTVLVIGGIFFATSGGKKAAPVVAEHEAIPNATVIWKDTGTVPNTGDSQLDTQNKQRVKNLEDLQTTVEAYYTSHSQYPTDAQMSSVSWMTENLLNFNPADLKDPTGTLSTLAAAPKKNQYSYQAGRDDTLTTCDNVLNNCNYYVFTTILSDGSSLTKVAQR